MEELRVGGVPNSDEHTVAAKIAPLVGLYVLEPYSCHAFGFGVAVDLLYH